ncbi:hypothetical protein D9615_001713 [Tricholomella constricta]|uniref:Uncharacterized protein n=1 Tax=Tricholomella constricta TaxID=117010 RepID=A0A8H5HPN6_9AGAR|nr:hypothetical protein D9615_001713 [Tricholomella constricta]
MASSSSPASQRRRPNRKRQPLSRSNSSFLGTIKNLVTAPLAWFASTDDFEGSKDFKGKRRRLGGAPAGSNVEEDDRSTRNKRMRVHSPPRDEAPSKMSSLAVHHGYLDPPGSVFQQQENRQSSPYNLPTSTHSVSVTQAYDFSNNNSNSIRANTLSRTMSIDPPTRPLSSASAMASIPLTRDTSMDSSSFIRNIPRDMSMPPLSARPSFRMRTSMTPQPLPPREVSEPPPLNTLVSNPTFVRAPPTKASESMQGGLVRQSSVTLGTLAESVRSARSPVRQRSSLLFGSSGGRGSHSPRPESAIEKALHELDIYKTPLVPTRLRSSNIPSTSSSSDLFKSRRASHLVLMQDDKRTSRLGRKVSGKNEPPLVNGTKPYAGEGGMKKLLARRKQEAEDEDHNNHGSILTKDDGDYMDDGVRKPDAEVASRVEPAPTIPPPLPPPTKTDWFSTNVSSSAATSSLRVGRTKARSHIARPARPSKTKFSAAYDDDDAMDDVDLDPEAIERKKEREALEEAAKAAPVFQIPEGFSFAKETKPVDLDPTNAKEPPIMSLPFSFSKPAPTSVNPPSQQQSTALSPAAPSPATSVFGTGSQLPSVLAPAPSLAAPSSPPVQPDEASVPASVLPSAPLQASATVPTTSTGIPNFFASSSVLTKSLELPKAAPLPFASPSVAPTTASNFHVPTPVKDVENPLWEGENKKESQVPANGSKLFDGFGGTAIGNAPATSSVFGGSSTSAFPSVTAPFPSIPNFGASLKKDESAPPPVPSSSFDGTSATTPTFSFTKPAEPAPFTLFGRDTPKATSPFGDVSTATTPMPTSTAPKPSAELPKPTTPAPESAFGSTAPKPPSLFGEPPKPTTSAPGPFFFGQPAPPAPSASEAAKPLFGTLVEAPKPLFGSGSGKFSFGGPTDIKAAEQKSTSIPFAVGAAPSTPPPVEVKKNAPFNFGAPETAPAPAPAQVGFSFSGGGSNASDVSSKPFAFGQPATMAPPVRPSTPPQNQEQEVSMEESPTRDAQQMNKPTDRPTIGGGIFPFGPSATVSTFQNNGPSAPFAFGSSSSVSNPFAKDNKPAENKSFGGFGQAAPSSNTFGFGQTKPPDNEPPRPNTTGSFSFGPTLTSATGPAPFAFGGPGNNSTGSAFGQSQPAGSAPGSPSTFNQASPFTFGAPLPPVNTSFSFGSQPASPAGGNNLSLPQPSTPGGFGGAGGAGFGQPQPSSPFGAPATSATAGGGALFTIGSAPAPAPVAGGLRQIRKLPNRRGGAKR